MFIRLLVRTGIPSTHLHLVSYICVNELGQHWFRKWLGACSAPSHYLNQHGLIVNWTLRGGWCGWMWGCGVAGGVLTRCGPLTDTCVGEQAMTYRLFAAKQLLESTEPMLNYCQLYPRLQTTTFEWKYVFLLRKYIWKCLVQHVGQCVQWGTYVHMYNRQNEPSWMDANPLQCITVTS